MEGRGQGAKARKLTRERVGLGACERVNNNPVSDAGEATRFEGGRSLRRL